MYKYIGTSNDRSSTLKQDHRKVNMPSIFDRIEYFDPGKKCSHV